MEISSIVTLEILSARIFVINLYIKLMQDMGLKSSGLVIVVSSFQYGFSLEILFNILHHIYFYLMLHFSEKLYCKTIRTWDFPELKENSVPLTSIIKGW